MHELYKELSDICEMLSDELAKTNAKLDKAGGAISAGDLEYIDKLTHAIKSVKTTKAMMEAEDDNYSNMYPYYYDNGNTNETGGMNNSSYAKGRGTYAKRDSMGRYSSRGSYEHGYSRETETISQLEDIMNDTKDENIKQEIKRTIQKIESMM